MLLTLFFHLLIAFSKAEISTFPYFESFELGLSEEWVTESPSGIDYWTIGPTADGRTCFDDSYCLLTQSYPSEDTWIYFPIFNFSNIPVNSYLRFAIYVCTEMVDGVYITYRFNNNETILDATKSINWYNFRSTTSPLWSGWFKKWLIVESELLDSANASSYEIFLTLTTIGYSRVATGVAVDWVHVFQASSQNISLNDCPSYLYPFNNSNNVSIRSDSQTGSPGVLFQWSIPNSNNIMAYQLVTKNGTTEIIGEFGMNLFETRLLLPQTNYQWKVNIKGRNGNIIQCPFWNFTTEAEPIINNFPYIEDFETGAGNWKTQKLGDSLLNTWVFDTPSKGDIKVCASGIKCWMNGLNDSIYRSHEYNWVLSPIFNFSQFDSDPILKFSLNLRTEEGFDGLFIQAWNESLKDWKTIGNNLDPDWYNFNYAEAALYADYSPFFSGEFSKWRVVSHRLSGLSGNPMALLRFAFASDDGIEERGVSFDDIVILAVQSVPMPTCADLYYPKNQFVHPLFAHFIWSPPSLGTFGFKLIISSGDSQQIVINRGLTSDLDLDLFLRVGSHYTWTIISVGLNVSNIARCNSEEFWTLSSIDMFPFTPDFSVSLFNFTYGTVYDNLTSWTIGNPIFDCESCLSTRNYFSGENSYILSPPIDLTEYSSANLSFTLRLDVTVADALMFEIFSDPAIGWELIYHPDYKEDFPVGWSWENSVSKEINFELSTEKIFCFRFRFEATSASNGREGATIDNLRIDAIKKSVTTDNVVVESPNSNAGIIIAGVLVPICILIAVVSVILVFKLRNSKKEKTANEESSNYNLVNQEKRNAEYNVIPLSDMERNNRYSDLNGNALVAKQSSEALFARLTVATTSERFLINYSEIQIELMVGRGAFGVVSKGIWRGNKVAVKQLQVLSSKQIEEFRSEAALMSALRPHGFLFCFVVTDLDSKCRDFLRSDNGSSFEFYENGSLYAYLRSKATISKSQITTWVKGIAAGMMHLHLENLVHRDLATRNVLLASNLDPKISDFGLSRLLMPDTSVATTQTNLGPIKHMAPESLKNRTYSPKTDVWSFGITIYEILVRGDPYPGLDMIATVVAVTSNSVEAALELPPNTIKDFPEITTIMRNCLNRDPNERPTFVQISNETLKF